MAIPNLGGKVFFITGGTAGLGRQTILTLAKHQPQQIILTGRNRKSAESVIAEIKKLDSNVIATFYECDQTSLGAVNGAARAFLATNPARLDVLICNAGMMGGPPSLTRDGYEMQFGVNFLAHALLIKRLLPILDQTAREHVEARLIALTSSGYAMYPGPLPLDKLKTTHEDIGMGGKWARYGQSKFALVIFASELAKRHPNITTISVNPGVIHTDLVQGLPMMDRIFVKMMTMGQSVSLEKGTHNTLWAATVPLQGNIVSGNVYYPVGVYIKHTKAASDEAQWKKFWKWTDAQLE